MPKVLYGSTEEALKQLDELYLKARQVATNFIGLPMDDEDTEIIERSTPMQAILALEQECDRIKKAYHRELWKNNKH
jgi:hypothetical protein